MDMIHQLTFRQAARNFRSSGQKTLGDQLIDHFHTYWGWEGLFDYVLFYQLMDDGILVL